MNENQFCIWLKGALDILETKTLNTKQVELIKSKLNSVFEHVVKPVEIIKSKYSNVPDMYGNLQLNVDVDKRSDYYYPKEATTSGVISTLYNVYPQSISPQSLSNHYTFRTHHYESLPPDLNKKRLC